MSSTVKVTILPRVKTSTVLRTGATGIKGSKGDQGTRIEIRESGLELQWRYEGDETWQTLSDDILVKAGNLSGITDPASARVNLEVYSQSEVDDEIAAHATRTDNPHAVTKAQVGLGSVNNTSDADKPVSTAQQAALDLKADSSHTHPISQVSGLQDALDGKQPAGDYATLDGTGKVPAFQLPSFVDDVLEFANLAAFPATGEAGKIYTAIDTGKIYRWGGSVYVEISAAPGSTDAVPEGSSNKYYTAARALADVTWATLTGIPSWITSATSYGKSLLAAADAAAAKTLLALVKADVGLGNVDNTSDASKPISTATQAALDLKAAQSSLDATNTALALKRNLYSGTTAPSNGAPYAAGDWYFNTTAGVFYGPYSGTAWPAGTSLVGPSNSLSIGTVTSNPGGSASATITGTSPSQTLNLVLALARLAIGTITTGAAGTNASATLDNTDPLNPVLALTIPRGQPGTGATAVVISTNTTAATGARYVTTASLTITDPTGTSAGQNYEVIVGSGTCTIGGVGYAASSQEIIRYFNGSAWVTLTPVLSQNLTLNGTANVAPNQTAASGSSLMTRDLVRFEKVLNTVPIHTSIFTQQAVTGSGTQITANLPNLMLYAASTTAFGAITALYNTEFRAGSINSSTPNFGLVNFDTPNLTFLFNLQSGGNNGAYDPATQSWGIGVGAYNSTPTADLATLFPSSGVSATRGYIGIRCVNGNVTILAQRGTATSVESAVLDTITGSFARQYALVKNGSSLQLYSDRTLLGSINEYPTGNLAAAIYINHTATAVSTATQRRLYIKDCYCTW